jgi:hypothetical protein
MKTIIRIEHPTDGKGIWRSKKDVECDINYIDTLSNFNEFLDKHRNFYTPYREPLIKDEFTDNHYCAFKSVEQLQQWITTDELKEFISFGFKVYTLDVQEWLEGEYQICYLKEDIIDTKDITELFI